MKTEGSEPAVADEYREILRRLKELHELRVLAGEHDPNAIEEPATVAISASAEDDERVRNPRIQVPSAPRRRKERWRSRLMC